MGRTDGTAEGDMRQLLPGSETQDLSPSTPGMGQCHPPTHFPPISSENTGAGNSPPNSHGSCIHLDSMIICVCSDANLMTGHFQQSKTHLCPHREMAGVWWGWGPG